MSSIDQRVVEMKFTNKQFENGVSSTMSMLDRLKSALKFDNVKNGLNDIGKNAKNLNLNDIGASVDSIKDKFSAMSVVGIAALGALAVKAVSVGADLVKGMIGPIQDGFAEYELKMNSIQTILSNTAKRGTSLEEVTAVLDNLNEYADLTVYNFGQMTEAIGQLTATGMSVDAASTSVKGFANWAAAAGVNSGDMAGAMVQLNQGLQAGTIKLQDWMSLEKRGMVNKNATEGIYEVAKAMGTFEGNAELGTLAQDNFRTSLSEGWLSADIMSNYLKIMSNEMTDAEWAALGLDEATEKMLRNQAQMAEDSATKVRTFSQLIGALQEGVGSGWAKTMELLIGDFNEATELFSAIFDTVGGILDASAANRNKMVEDFVKLGGRDDIIQGVKNLYEAAIGFMKPIQDAWNAVFGPKNAESVGLMARVLKAITGGFLKFTEAIKMGANSFGIVTGIFKILFSILKGAGFLLGALAKGLLAVFSVVGNLVVGLVRFLGAMASMGVAFGSWLMQTEEAQRIFKALRDTWDAITDTLRHFGEIIGEAFGHFSDAVVALRQGLKVNAVLAFQAALATLGVSTKRASIWANWLVDNFNKLKTAGKDLFDRLPLDSFADGLEYVSESFSNLRDKLGNRKGINTGSLDGARDKVAKIGAAATGVAAAFEWLWNAFKWVGRQIKTIAIWIGPIIMSIADFIGTMVGKAKEYLEGLTFAEILALVNTGFFILMYKSISGFFKNLNKIGKGFAESLDGIGEALESFSKRNDESVATKILKIAIAIAILAASAYVLTTVDTVKLIIALGAIAVMLGLLVGSLKLMSKIEFKSNSKIIKAAIALAIMSLAILALASAAKKISGLDWEELAKGLVGVSVLLAGLALFTKFSDMGGKDLIKGALSLIVLAGALYLLSFSVDKFGQMDGKTLAKGLGTVGLLLVALMAMTKVMNNAKLMSAAFGLLILSGSLLALAYSLRFYENLDWKTLEQGLGKMAAILVTLGISARFLPRNLPATAAGVAIMAAAMYGMTFVLEKLGKMDIYELIQSMLALVTMIGVMAGAMWVMSAPGVLAGAAALLVVVGALYLLVPLLVTMGMLPWEVVALGLGALAVGLGLIVGAGALAQLVMPGLITLAAVILAISVSIGIAAVGLALFAAAFTALVVAVTAGIALLWTVFQGIMTMLPLVAQQIGLAVTAFAVVIRDAGPAVVEAIGVVISSIIDEVERLTPEVITMFTGVVLQTAYAIEETAPELVASFMRMLLRIVEEIRLGAPAILAEFLLMILNLLETARFYVPAIIDEFMRLVMEILVTLRGHIPEIVEEAARMMVEFLNAVTENIGPIVDAATQLIVMFIERLEYNTPELVDAAASLITTFIDELVSKLLGGIPALRDAALEMAYGMISGLTSGIEGSQEIVSRSMRTVAASAFVAAKVFLGIRSPSRLFMKLGEHTSEGLAIGISNYSGVVAKAAEGVGHDAIFAMKKTIAALPSAIDDNVDFNPTIRPVLDLSELQSAARGIDPMLASTIAPTTTLRSATGAEMGYESNRDAVAEQVALVGAEARKVEFNQHIHSPKAVSNIEIYRQTNNQLALMKEV